jgi:hypothetical protein
MKIIIKLSIFLVLAFFPLFVFGEINFPSYPMAFWGSAKIDNNNLPAGTEIRGYCGENLIGKVTMLENGIYGYEDATKIRLLVSNCDSDILFKYLLSDENEPKTGVSEIKYTDGFEEGKTIRKDLNFTTIVSTPTPPTPTPSGGGGGGGVGGATTPPSYKTGDINKDNKVDKYDFSLMMANWGKTGTNTCDLNGDGKVDKYDFALLMSKWGL